MFKLNFDRYYKNGGELEAARLIKETAILELRQDSCGNVHLILMERPNHCVKPLVVFFDGYEISVRKES